jgi:predicted glycosyltransferase
MKKLENKIIMRLEEEEVYESVMEEIEDLPVIEEFEKFGTVILPPSDNFTSSISNL